MDFPTHPIGWKPLTIKEKKERDEKKSRNKKQLHVELTQVEKQWMFVRCVAETWGSTVIKNRVRYKP
jgi:hypothetical protein